MQFELNEQGKISLPTMRTLFSRIVLQNAEFQDVQDPLLFFLVGMKCYERLICAAGVDIAALNGVELFVKLDDPTQN